MERNITDVRDIFSRPANDRPKQELRSYDYSPRSRRRNDMHNEFSDYRRPALRSSEQRFAKETQNFKKPSKERDLGHDDPREFRTRKHDDNHKSSANKNGDSSHYSTRTLTERDIRHLERHLSMKKTIRKQISRNLAQAFVEDPEIVLKEVTPVQPKDKPSDKSFTLTRAKVSKSEQNVLELLKDNEPDSGHCSADNHCSSDEDAAAELEKQYTKTERSFANQPRVENRTKKQISTKEDGKFSSFWKMFSMKNKDEL